MFDVDARFIERIQLAAKNGWVGEIRRIIEDGAIPKNMRDSAEMVLPQALGNAAKEGWVRGILEIAESQIVQDPHRAMAVAALPEAITNCRKRTDYPQSVIDFELLQLVGNRRVPKGTQRMAFDVNHDDYLVEMSLRKILARMAGDENDRRVDIDSICVHNQDRIVGVIKEKNYLDKLPYNETIDPDIFALLMVDVMANWRHSTMYHRIMDSFSFEGLPQNVKTSIIGRCVADGDIELLYSLTKEPDVSAKTRNRAFRALPKAVEAKLELGCDPERIRLALGNDVPSRERMRVISAISNAGRTDILAQFIKDKAAPTDAKEHARKALPRAIKTAAKNRSLHQLVAIARDDSLPSRFRRNAACAIPATFLAEVQDGAWYGCVSLIGSQYVPESAQIALLSKAVEKGRGMDIRYSVFANGMGDAVRMKYLEICGNDMDIDHLVGMFRDGNAQKTVRDRAGELLLGKAEDAIRKGRWARVIALIEDKHLPADVRKKIKASMFSMLETVRGDALSELTVDDFLKLSGIANPLEKDGVALASSIPGPAKADASARRRKKNRLGTGR